MHNNKILLGTQKVVGSDSTDPTVNYVMLAWLIKLATLLLFFYSPGIKLQEGVCYELSYSLQLKL